jgi:hypothetical protein
MMSITFKVLCVQTLQEAEMNSNLGNTFSLKILTVANLCLNTC